MIILVRMIIKTMAVREIRKRKMISKKYEFIEFRNDINSKLDKKTESIDEHLINREIREKQSQNRKVKKGVVFYVIALFIIAFYAGAYFISRDILTSYQEGFYQYDAFFVRNTCLTETYF